jgi:hypothetical protein
VPREFGTCNSALTAWWVLIRTDLIDSRYESLYTVT